MFSPQLDFSHAQNNPTQAGLAGVVMEHGIFAKGALTYFSFLFPFFSKEQKCLITRDRIENGGCVSLTFTAKYSITSKGHPDLDLSYRHFLIPAHFIF